jgi:hypothetical protein
MMPGAGLPIRLLALCALLLAPLSQADAAEVADVAGRIETVRVTSPADAVIMREGKPLPVQPLGYLYPGDVLRVSGAGAWVRVRTTAAPDGRIVDASTGPLLVANANARRLPAPPGALRIIEALLQQRRTEQVLIATRTRFKNPPQQPRAESPIAPLGVQSVPVGAQRVAAVWSGPPASLVLRDASGATVATISSARPAALVELPAPGGPLRLSTAAGDLHWDLRWAAAASLPRPPWLDAAAPPTEADRTLWATWLLTDAPPTWRLYALGELAELSANDFLALVVWQAAASGELKTVLEATPKAP